ncbi:UbiA prenyltransferase family protein [Pontibacter burrus]|uniref:Prenyltransferase n=1 Tax=Pontibacter burrus TaxID=2704466 RepID=A0A6B3LRF4_9BACT|nr:hypothetical protein [Pontibacter burrus]NEM96568.1 hypothetical protein [Pontibacter burrus]
MKKSHTLTKKKQVNAGMFRQLLNYLLYSSVFISVCAFSLTIETYLLAELPVSLPMAVFVFLATLFTYNLSSIQRVLLHRNAEPERNQQQDSWWHRHRVGMAIVGTGSLGMATIVYFYFGLRLNFWFLLHLAIISIGYTIPIVYRRKDAKPLRRVPLLKVFLIAYVWAVVTGLFPLIDAGIFVLEPQALQLFLRRFLFILALALLFDIRDYTYDRQTNTLTVPGLIGVNYTKLLSVVLLLVYALIVVQSESGGTMLALLVSALIAGLVVLFSSEFRPRVYFLLLADGAMLLHAVLVFLASS